MKRATFALALLFAAACATTPPPAEPVHVILVGTTDVHGWYDGKESDGVRRGGVALLASYVEALRAKHGDRVILLDSGDMWQGTMESNLFEGEPVVRAYNAMGYAGAAVGNHEFDYGPVGPRVRAEAGEDELEVLKKMAGIARFPLLSANMKERATGQTPSWAKRYVMVRAGGANVGIIGLSTPDTPNVTIEANVRNLVFTDPVAATVEAAGELRAQGADAVVVIAHIGGNCAGLHDPQDTSKCEDDLEGVALLKALPEGTVDAYLGGHVHRGRMRHFINGTAAAQSAPYSDEFSTIELAIDTQANRVIDERSSIRMPTQICEKVYSGTESCDPRTKPADAALVQRTFEGRAVGREPRIQAVVQPFLQQVEAKRNERLGITTAAEFKRGFAGESTLGNLLADALREWAGADIGIMNAGGIRSDLRAGELIYADIFNVAPFENYPAVLQMTGKEVFDALDVVTRGNRGLLQVSGIRYTVDDATRRVTSVTLPDGTPIDPARTYRVVMPDFLAFGGDGMAPVTNSIPRERIVIDQEAPLRDAIIEALRKRGGPLSPAIDGRISVLNRQPR